MEAYMRRTVVRNPRIGWLLWPVFVVVLAMFSAAALLARQPGEDFSDPAAGGMLMLRDKDVATEMPAVRLATDIAVKVSGPVARVTVTQAFRNASRRWMEATYLYPLPDDGAVDGLKMVVGGRIFVGRIKPRE